MSVLKKINLVTAELSKQGITKDQYNKHSNYNYRGIDDVYNVLAPILSSVGLAIIPQVQSFTINPAKTSSGKDTFHGTAIIDYLLCDTDSEGDTVKATIVGEGMDNGDKTLNKCMSAAYKLLVFQTFCVPTEGGSVDSESESIERAVEVEKFGLDEVGAIRGLLSKTNTDETQFCEYLKVNALADLPLGAFAKVNAMLVRKLNNMSQEYAQDQRNTHNSEEANR